MDLLKDDKLLPLAAKYASRLGRMHLADKLTNLAETWERESDKINAAQNSHFVELDAQECYDVANDSQDLNTSLIIPQKNLKKNSDEITPLRPVVSLCYIIWRVWLLSLKDKSFRCLGPLVREKLLRNVFFFTF